jgi:hypothetical protein
VVIDCDACAAFGKGAVLGPRPDFVILDFSANALRGRWCVIEMKATFQSATDVRSQLQAAADLIADHPLFRISGSPVVLLPLVLHSKGAKTLEVTLLGRMRIRFNGIDIPILVRRCGVELVQLVPRLASRRR